MLNEKIVCYRGNEENTRTKILHYNLRNIVYSGLISADIPFHSLLCKLLFHRNITYNFHQISISNISFQLEK